MTPLASAIVLNYKSPKDTARCVQALQAQTMADQMEILVVDNHSEDDSIGYLRSRSRNFASMRLLETGSNRGYGKGNEVAIAQALGEFLLIINPDNILEPSGLENMIRIIESDSSIGIVAPALVHPDGSIRDSHRAFPTPIDVFIKRTFLRRIFRKRMHRYLRSYSKKGQMQDVDWVVGACFVIRRSFYKELGGFDPRFFLFFEDTDLCRQCWKHGKRVVYCPEVHALDRKQRLSDGGFLSLITKKTARIHLLSALKYFWKWKGRAVSDK
jgi:GT2 family glycosyltransferase